MNEKELKIVEKIELIKKEIENIKIDTLRVQLLKYFERECKLDKALNLLPPQVITSLDRFEEKIKFYQQIEIDLPNKLILSGEESLLLKKFDTLRGKIAILCHDRENEITKNYHETKNFILKILDLNINLKLNYFDLTIKILDKIADPRFNKKFMRAFYLLKSLVNESQFSDEDLQYISSLGRETNEEDIRKYFYRIIYEIDKDLFFKILLKQFLKILENHHNSPLIQFNIIFVNLCLHASEMAAIDFYQLINIVCETLENSNEQVRTKTRLEKIINPEKLVDLSKFKKDLKEKLSAKIIDELVKPSLQEKKSYFLANILDGLDFVTYFPTCINNKKIKNKLYEAKFNYTKILEKKITSDYFRLKFFSEGLTKVGSKTYEFITNAGAKVSDVKENLKDFVENTTERLTDFIKKKSEASYLEENEESKKSDMKISLIEAKEKILLIKKKLDTSNLFNINIDLNNSNHYNLAINQFNINQVLESIAEADNSINNEFTQMIQRLLEELNKIRATIKEKNPWFIKYESNEPSLFLKLFRRGYFNSNFTYKKIKTYLNNDLSFDRVNGFFLKQSFLGLLSYGIFCWPWENKIDFAKSWAEQFSFLDDINQIEQLENVFTIEQDQEKILKKVKEISKKFWPYQNDIASIIEKFRGIVIKILGQLEKFEEEINVRLLEKKRSLLPFSPNSTGFFNGNSGLESSDNKMEKEYLEVKLKVH